MKGEPDARLLAAATTAVVLGASFYAAIGAALGTYSPGPLALVRMLVAERTFRHRHRGLRHVFYARVGVIVEPGLNLTFYIRGQLTEGVARYL